MSVMYATLDDLASYLQEDIDTATGTVLLEKASQLFSTRANTMFVPTTVTYQSQALGYRQLFLPFYPVSAVSAVRIVSNFTGTPISQTITDYARIKNVLYRLIGFGVPGMFPPDMIEVDLTYGYSTTPDDVAAAVLEMAATAYNSPDPSVSSESIDDYSVRTAANLGGLQLSAGATALADLYRGTLAA